MRRSLLSSVLLTAACAGPIPANGLFVEVDEPVDVPSHADRARVVSMSEQPVVHTGGPRAQETARAEVTLPLFDDVIVTAVHDEVVLHGPDAYTWVGHERGEPQSEVLLSYRGDAVSGIVRRGQHSYVIQPHGPGTQLVLEVSADTLIEGDEPPDAVLDLFDTSWAAADADGEDPVIDVLVVYSAAVKSALGSADAVQALSELAITQANKGLLDSKASASFRLVAVEGTTWDEKPFTFSSALTGVATPEDGLLDSVPALRDTHGADVVTLLVVGDEKACGLGYLMGVSRPAFAPAAYSVVDYRCAVSNYSLAHEIGHNMGSHHDRDNASSAPAYPFGYGHQVPDKGYRSIMAYSCDKATCSRVNRWSNPDVSYLDAATGVAKTSETSAHNAASLSLTAPVVADFRETVPESSPEEAAEITLPADGATLGGASMTLVWGDVEADEYVVTVGSADGKDDLLHKSAGTATSWTVTGLPVDGSKLHVMLWSRFGDEWYTDNAVYNAFTASKKLAVVTSPPADSTLKGSTISFSWNDVGADGYVLRLGSSRWGADLGAHATTGTSVTVASLPVDGRTVWATLYTDDDGRWYSDTVTYSAKPPVSGPPEPARLLSPTEDVGLVGKAITFEWTRPKGATEYGLTLVDGSGAVIYNESMPGTAALVELSEIPVGPVEVRLYSKLDEHWFIRSYSYAVK